MKEKALDLHEVLYSYQHFFRYFQENLSMKYFINSLRYTIFIPVLVMMLFTQCNVNEPRYQDEITKHFGELNYLQVNFPGKVKFDSNEKIVTAKGVVRHETEEIPSVSWIMFANADGELGDFYVGSTSIPSNGVVEMTADDFVSGSQRCWDISSVGGGTIGERDRCLSDLYLLALAECVLASDGSSEFSCDDHCWMNNSQCF